MSYQEIKTLFEEELKKTNEWEEIILLSDYIKQSIINPGVQMNIIYNFSKQIDTDIFKLCFKLNFGFSNDNLNESCIVVYMGDFL